MARVDGGDLVARAPGGVHPGEAEQIASPEFDDSVKSFFALFAGLVDWRYDASNGSIRLRYESYAVGANGRHCYGEKQLLEDRLKVR